MIRYAMFAAFVLVTAFLSYDLGQRGAKAYEGMLKQRVLNGLDVLELDWAEIRADGLRLELHGHAPDLFARELAMESAQATAPTASIENFATATLAPPPTRDPIRVELQRDVRGVTMIGQLSGRAMRETLNELLSEDAPDLEIHDLTGVQAKAPPRGWGPELRVASLATSRLPNAHVVIQPGRVEVSGQAANAEERTALTTDLLDRGEDVVAVAVNVRIPARVIAPFIFSAYKDAGGGIRVERCAARSVGEQSIILSALHRAGAVHHQAVCPIGLGGPSGDWPAAVRNSIETLSKLPAGRIDLEYSSARIEAHPPTDPTLFASAESGFLAKLPDGFTGRVELRTDDAATRASIGREQYWMRINRREEAVVLTGQVHQIATKTAIETYAMALFGAGHLQTSLTLTDAAPPRDWQTAAMRLLDILSTTRNSSADLAGHRLSLSATVTDAKDVRTMHRALQDALPRFQINSAIEVDLPKTFLAIPLPGPRCASELNETNNRTPIDFDQGSASISKESLAVLDDLARHLARCTSDRIEIGGHTDSVGSDDVNERISQSRADAVLKALIRRGVPPRHLVAKGYGESLPIADNQTEQGRARNRRIEFTALGQPRADQQPESEN